MDKELKFWLPVILIFGFVFGGMFYGIYANAIWVEEYSAPITGSIPYEGHGSPFRRLTVTTPDGPKEFTVACTYYDNGEPLPIKRSNQYWWTLRVGGPSAWYLDYARLPLGCVKD